MRLRAAAGNERQDPPGVCRGNGSQSPEPSGLEAALPHAGAAPQCGADGDGTAAIAPGERKFEGQRGFGGAAFAVEFNFGFYEPCVSPGVLRCDADGLVRHVAMKRRRSRQMTPEAIIER